MNSILQALADRGVNPDDTVLIGTLRHVPAGDKEHYSGKMVDVFKPAASHLRIEHKDRGDPILTFACDGESLVDDEAFWANMKASEGVNPADVVALALGLVSSHRSLVGSLARTYEIIESDPAEIEKIKAQRKDLRVGLIHLMTFLEKDLEMFESIFVGMASEENKAESDAAHDRLRYERDSLLHVFIQQPCERELYDGLRKEYAESRHLGLGFDNYYEWFRRSEAKFATADGIPSETRDLMKYAMNAWLTVADKPTEDWIEGKKRLFFRNFEVHPRHHDQVAAALSETLSGLQAERDNAPAKAAKP